MQVRRIDFDDEGIPSSLTVSMSTREAALVARMIGRTNGNQRAEVQSDGSVVGSDIYDCLTGAFFNCFWDAGVDEVGR